VALKRDLTPKEQREALNVPSLDGDNTFTGSNLFTGLASFDAVTTSHVGTASDLTLLTVDTINVQCTPGTVTFDFTAANNGDVWAFPAGGGTLSVVGGTLSLAYNAQSGTYAVQDSDGIVNATSGTWTATLPSAVSRDGRVFIVKNSGAGVITVAGSGGQTVDGAASVTVASGAAVRVASNGANWITI
jgi:hypothetical protein